MGGQGVAMAREVAELCQAGEFPGDSLGQGCWAIPAQEVPRLGQAQPSALPSFQHPSPFTSFIPTGHCDLQLSRWWRGEPGLRGKH
jgi:hypothetical protein